eukprot:m.47234 g.47234  ORF g.47234 m.47234 type:complete len:146 (-) comp13210_c0_seq5:216-653(-)
MAALSRWLLFHDGCAHMSSFALGCCSQHDMDRLQQDLSQAHVTVPAAGVYEQAHSIQPPMGTTPDGQYARLADVQAPTSPDGYESWSVRDKPARATGVYTPASIASNYSQASIYSSLDATQRVQPAGRRQAPPTEEPTYDRLKRS